MYACRAGGPIQGNLTWSVETCPINVMPREKTCKVFVPFLLVFFGKKDEEGKEETLGVRKGRDIFLAIFLLSGFFLLFSQRPERIKFPHRLSFILLVWFLSSSSGCILLRWFYTEEMRKPSYSETQVE